MDSRLMHVMLAADEHHWWYRGRRSIVNGELERLGLGTGLQLLDAGCGSGRTLLDLKRYGSVSGVEIDPDALTVAAGRGAFDVRAADVTDLPWEPGTFDAITCLDVIEHIADDVAALSEMRRVSRPTAILLVTVPAYQLLWSRHDVANHHFRRYSRTRLRVALGLSGWRLERMTSFNSLLLAPVALVRLLQRDKPVSDEHVSDLKLGPRWLNAVLEQPLRAEARWLRTGRTLPLGLSLLAIARNGG